MKNQFWTKTLVSTGLALLVVGCDDPFKRSSDPLENYQELRADGPPSQYKVHHQNYDGIIFDLEVPQAESTVLNFYEGKESSYTINTRVAIEGVNYRLVGKDLPKGSSLNPGPTPGSWIFKWAPALNTIPAGLTNQTSQVMVVFEIDANSTARAREKFDLDRRNRVQKLTLVVNYASAQPTLKVSGLDFNKELQRGDVVPMTFEITDPNSTKDRKPILVVDFDKENQTAENRRFPANNVVIYDPKRSDKFLGNGKWIFYRLLDTTLIPSQYLDPRAKYTGGEFVVAAINMSTKLDSINQLVRFNVKAKEVVP